MVPTFTIYRALCERLETLGNVTDATSCFYQMMRDLEARTNPHIEQELEWVPSE